MRRELAVIVALLVGAVGGFYLSGGRITPALINNPDTIPVGPALWAVAAGAALAYGVNRWIEHGRNL
jgi:hypothetical protein